MFEHLESLFVLFAVDEVNHALENVYRPLASNHDGFMSEVSNIPEYCVNRFPKLYFYVMGDFNYNLFTINSNSR